MSFNLQGPTQSAQQAYEANVRRLQDNANKLATAQRINRGADDPAGLISSEALRAELAALEAESRAASRADAVASVADAALGEASELLIDAGAAEVRLADGFLSDAERDALTRQRDDSVRAAERVLNTASFAGGRLFSGDVQLRIGEGELDFDRLDSSTLGSVESGGASYTLGDVTNGSLDDDPQLAVQVFAAARDQVATLRGRVGAFQRNVAEPVIRANAEAMVAAANAESVIRDADFAKVASEAVRDQILSQSSARTLGVAQASQSRVIGLLGGG